MAQPELYGPLKDAIQRELVISGRPYRDVMAILAHTLEVAQLSQLQAGMSSSEAFTLEDLANALRMRDQHVVIRGRAAW